MGLKYHAELLREVAERWFGVRTLGVGYELRLVNAKSVRFPIPMSRCLPHEEYVLTPTHVVNYETVDLEPVAGRWVGHEEVNLFYLATKKRESGIVIVLAYYNPEEE